MLCPGQYQCHFVLFRCLLQSDHVVRLRSNKDLQSVVQVLSLAVEADVQALRKLLELKRASKIRFGLFESGTIWLDQVISVGKQGSTNWEYAV
jgi:hypothetical protein